MVNMTCPQNAQVTVLGAGIVGLCTALFLEKAGIHVKLIDAAEPGQGASFGNAGVISPWSVIPHSVPGVWKRIPGWLLNPDGPVSIRSAYLPWLLPWTMRFLSAGKLDKVLKTADAMLDINRANVDLYRNILRESGKEDLIQDSFYVHAYRHPEMANIHAIEYSIRKDRGAEIEQIGTDELRQLEPAIAPEFKTAILIKNQGRTLSPGKICEVISTQLKALGTEFVKEKIVGLTTDSKNQWHVQTDSGKHQATTVVVAMGAWSAKLLASIGVTVPMETERGYHAEFLSEEVKLTHSVMDVDLKMVASSMGERIRIAGTAEFAGLDYPANEKRMAKLVEMTKRMLPGLQENYEPTVWMGSRPSMPDSLPCIGEIQNKPNLYAAFGHSHHGLMMAPHTGQIIADLISGTQPDIDLKPFQPNRFSPSR